MNLPGPLLEFVRFIEVPGMPSDRMLVIPDPRPDETMEDWQARCQLIVCVGEPEEKPFGNV